MTQYFAYQKFRLWRAPLQTRVLLTIFDLFMVAATAVGIVMYRVRTGLTLAGAREYYLGNEATAGPAEPMKFQRTVAELLDVTHPHAFSQAFLFFILCHIFALTRASDRLKITVYVVSFASVGVDLVVPYLIRFVSPAFAPLQIANYIVMSAALLVLIAVPIQEMWFYEPERRADE